MVQQLGKIGVWRAEAGLSPHLAASLERLGYGTIWIGGSPDGGLAVAEELLAATTTITIATGIINIWKDKAELVADSYHRLEERHPGRFLLGVGAGHPEATADYRKPYEALERYLDVLDARDVPVQRRVLAALGPKVLQLAADRTAGAHPYLTVPEHTRRARQLLGPDVLLAPEQKVVLDTDPERARSIGRPVVATPYLGLSNYLNNLRSLGYSDADFADGGSDELIDALVARGDARTAAAGVSAHLDAGADHVAIQLLTAPGTDPVAGYTALAEVLL
ncbi:MAG: LLM class F420-dependent oxidoreductase [Actinomycetota bacterium]|nr:LLM class F420-dependent oxidoreductase [Actinomycetota bacterium]MDQ2959325.1 LLM class F420-dependent oxidoreductase [Actinomycetota bacterium]